ncbi:MULTISPECIES: fimbrial biogenesis chaperone [unclassified Providencia]|uniref:fimbrial biogenesis chaperone n=1 Tax=unclassified Providencia TaxID=2633465 RepID=UPI002349CD46|nr:MULTISPECIES: molecular chaperone [unclassified Providencia]
MKFLLKYLCFLPILPVFSAFGNIQDDITFRMLRNTYTEKEKSTSVKLSNKGERSYLVQGSMELLDEKIGNELITGKKEEIPFIITPPLFKLEPKQSYSWRVMFSGDSAKLPADRESLYIAKFRLIPATTKPTIANGVNSELSVINVVATKIYYRPIAFEKLEIKNEISNLKFKIDGDDLVVTNNSPIYMAFDEVSVNSVPVDSKELYKPLIPKSEQRFKLPKKVSPSGNKIEWAVLDEFAMPTPKSITKI